MLPIRTYQARGNYGLKISEALHKNIWYTTWLFWHNYVENNTLNWHYLCHNSEKTISKKFCDPQYKLSLNLARKMICNPCPLLYIRCFQPGVREKSKLVRQKFKAVNEDAMKWPLTKGYVSFVFLEKSRKRLGTTALYHSDLIGFEPNSWSHHLKCRLHDSLCCWNIC